MSDHYVDTIARRGPRPANAVMLRLTSSRRRFRGRARLFAPLAGLCVVMCLAAPAFAATVVLGGGGDAGSGLGRALPARVWFGGDASTLFFRLRWARWGGKVATGSGRGYWRPPYANSVPVRVRADRLGLCRGRRAYLEMRVSYRVGRRWTRFGRFGTCQ